MTPLGPSSERPSCTANVPSMVGTTEAGLSLSGREPAAGGFGFCHHHSLELLGRTALGFPFSEKDLKSHEWLEIKPSEVMTPDRRENRNVMKLHLSDLK